MNYLVPLFLWIGVTFVWGYGQGLCAIRQALPVWYTIPIFARAAMIMLHVTLLHAIQMKVKKKSYVYAVLYHWSAVVLTIGGVLLC